MARKTQNSYPKTEEAIIAFLEKIGDRDGVTKAGDVYIGTSGDAADAFTGLVNAMIANEATNKAFPDAHNATVNRIKDRLLNPLYASGNRYNNVDLEGAFKELKDAAQARATVMMREAEQAKGATKA